MPNLFPRLTIWKLKTSAFKLYVRLQDRLGLYSYARWIQENEHGNHQGMSPEPGVFFSFLVLISPESLPYLSPTLHSLEGQTHPHWEACLIYEQACIPEVEATLRKLSEEETRFLHLALEPGQKPVENIAVAFDRVQGNWVGRMECGDCLSPGALAAYVDCIHNHSQAEVIYADEDHLTPDGKTRHSPFFKPDFSPDLLLSVNYLLTAFFHRDLITACSTGVRDFEELVYLCAEQARGIVHIPKVLYHVHPKGNHPGDNRYAETMAHKVISPKADRITGHLNRLGLPDARVHYLSSGEAQATWSFEEKLVSIIIPTRDHVAFLKQCLDSVINQTRYRRFEIILVENNSQEAETLAYYKQLESIAEVRLLEFPGTFNYSAANNLGAHQALGDWLLFLNNDIEIIDPGWLEELCRWLSRPEVGAVGAKLLYPDGRIQHAGIIIGMEGHASHVFAGVKEGYSGIFGSANWYRDYIAVTGACLATRREVFESVSGFDEGYQLAFSDVDICQRILQKGYRVVYTPFACLLHHEGMTRNRYIPAQDIQRGAERFKQVVKQGDPYYNPNLSHAVKIPTLKRPHEEEPIVRLENIVQFY